MGLSRDNYLKQFLLLEKKKKKKKDKATIEDM